MNFDDSFLPQHIERANLEARTTFSHLRGVEGRPLESQLAKILDIPFERIDLGLAWAEVDSLLYRAIFKETGGDMDSMYDGFVRSRIHNRLFHQLPVNYYVKLLEKEGIMDSVDIQGDTVYFIKEAYKDSVNTLSMEMFTNSGR